MKPILQNIRFIYYDSASRNVTKKLIKKKFNLKARLRNHISQIALHF